MKKVYQLFVLFMLLCGSAYSQHVASIPALRSANSIIRTVGEDMYLLYNLSPSGEARFVFDKSGTVKSFVLPAGMTVGDVEMDSTGNAWFCGKKDSNGVVGWFNVVGVFTGTDVVHYSMLTLPAYLPRIHPCELSRLDLADSSGMVIMAMTGGMQFQDQPQIYPAVVSATYNAAFSNPWRYWYCYNKDCNIVYTDIAALKSVIIATATDSTGHGSYLKYFKKYSSFPKIPFVSMLIDQITGLQNCDGPMLVSRYRGDTAVTVQYHKSPCSIVSHLVRINPSPAYSLVLNTFLTNPWNCNLGLGSGDMRELRNCGGESIFALHHGYHPSGLTPSMASWLVDLSAGYAGGSVTGYELTYGYAHSLDRTVNTGMPTVCGKITGGFVEPLALSRPDVMSTPTCMKTYDIEVSHPEVTIVPQYNAELDGQNVSPDVVFVPQIESHAENVICQ